jgi:hypothetical protein
MPTPTATISCTTVVAVVSPPPQVSTLHPLPEDSLPISPPLVTAARGTALAPAAASQYFLTRTDAT